MSVQIHELRVSASGMSPEQARCFGEAIAKRLSELRLAPDQSRTVRSITVRVPSTTGGSIERLASVTANAIRRSLG